MTRSQTTAAFVARLTDREVTDLIDTQVKRIRAQARDDALSYASLLVSTLRVAGLHDDADAVDAVYVRLLG